MGVRPRRVEIEIETLSLARLPHPADHGLIAAALRRELRGLGARGVRVPGSDPESLGEQIAAAVLREVGR
jgi:hypothetical protein